jgi:hypothetical protein
MDLLTLCACITTIGMHIGSQHFGGEDPSQYNNTNPGLYVRSEGWTAGFYRNSYRRDSIYGGYTFESRDQRWAVTTAYITGYSHTKFTVAPSVRLFKTPQRISARLIFIPPIGDESGLVHFALEKDL